MKHFIKEIRISKKLTQQEVADALFISQPSYNHIETGHVALTFEIALKLTEIFNCSLNDLAGIKTDLNIPGFEKIEEKNVEIILYIKKLNNN